MSDRIVTDANGRKYITHEPAPGRTDFTGWQRSTLERFAREVADENLSLRADLKTVLDAWRSEVEGAS